MENLNLPPFYVGQKVVCVDPRPDFGLFKDKIYTIAEVIRCKCGATNVAWGATNPLITHSSCYSCGNIVTQESKYYFCRSSRFAPVQEQKFPLIKLTKVIEKEKQLMSAN